LEIFFSFGPCAVLPPQLWLKTETRTAFFVRPLGSLSQKKQKIHPSLFRQQVCCPRTGKVLGSLSQKIKYLFCAVPLD